MNPAPKPIVKRARKPRKQYPCTVLQAKALEAIQRDYRSKKALIERVFQHKGSLRQALNAKCLDCSSFDVNEVRNCPCETCPTWRYRPYQQ